MQAGTDLVERGVWFNPSSLVITRYWNGWDCKDYGVRRYDGGEGSDGTCTNSKFSDSMDRFTISVSLKIHECSSELIYIPNIYFNKSKITLKLRNISIYLYNFHKSYVLKLKKKVSCQK